MGGQHHAPEPPPAAAGVGQVVAGLIRLALAVGAMLIVLGAVAEVGLRWARVEPLAAREPSNVVPDGWTGFRLRPGVSGPEAFVTNDLGMHADRSYAVTPAPGVLRVAVLGSSVAYGLNLPIAETIPSAIERELAQAGRRAEVLNFGTHAFSVVNVSAMLQAYVHQLRPHVVVVVVDLQVGRAIWPPLRPSERSSIDEGAAVVTGWRALVSRVAGRSALLGVLDDPRAARRWLRRTTGLQLHPHPGLEPLVQDARSGTVPGLAPEPPASIGGAEHEDLEEYERRRQRELVAPLAAMASFAAATSSAFYVVTPYGPYFQLTDEEFARMNVHHFIEDAVRLHADPRAALAAEVVLLTHAVRRAAESSPARVIDMLEASQRSSLSTSRHFTRDGVHLTPEGNAALGRVIAERILADLGADAAQGR